MTNQGTGQPASIPTLEQLEAALERLNARRDLSASEKLSRWHYLIAQLDGLQRSLADPTDLLNQE